MEENQMTFSAAELGLMKQVVAQMQASKNKGEQTKCARNIIAYLSHMHGLRHGVRLVNIDLVEVHIKYSLEENDTSYSFLYQERPAKE